MADDNKNEDGRRVTGRTRAVNTSERARSRRSFSSRPPRGSSGRHADRQKKSQAQTEERINLSPLRDGEIRLIVLGGVSEIGKNMYALEYKGDIVVFESGILFGEQITPGVGAMMPNIEYLKSRKHDIKGIVLSDTTVSHAGALPLVLNEFGNPTIYSRAITHKIVEKRITATNPRLNPSFHDIEKETSIKITDNITLSFFAVSENTPSTFGVLFETPNGCVAYTGSLRIDHKDGEVAEYEAEKYAVLKDKNILLVLSGSVNAEKNGFAISEKQVLKELAGLVEEADGRIILPLFASQIKRSTLILDQLTKMGKKVYIHGDEMHANLEMASELGLTVTPKECMIPISELNREDQPEKTVILLETEENEDYPVLTSAAHGNHRYLDISPGDTIIFPNVAMPTKASELQTLKNQLSRIGAVIESYSTDDTKAVSHAGKNELLWLHKQIRSRYFVPIQGYHYMLTAHTHIARESGVGMGDCIIPENGMVIEISHDGQRVKRLRNKIPKRVLSVDGKNPSTVYDIVLQERKIISQEGIFIIIVLIDRRKLTLTKSPDIISRGFIYLKESQDLITRARLLIKEVSEQEAQATGSIEIDSLKKVIQKSMRNLLMAETAKQPVIIPVIFT